VAETLAQTLVASVQDESDDEDNDIDMAVTKYDPNNNNSSNNDDEDVDEWQISFVYEPMQSFIPMNPAQKDEVTNKLERRLSLRPSQQQIEVWGVVPPQYFESPEQSFLRQALGREIALDLLEGFLPQRKDIYNLANRGIMHPDFITQDHEEAVQQKHKRKQSMMDELNSKLDPKRRPSIVQLSDKGLIPENWLLDLYGLADTVRKRHKKMDSAVLDLKSQLNVPPILADVVARDVLDEIETVDPYLKINDSDDDDDEDVTVSQLLNGRRESNDASADEIRRLKKEIEALNQTVSEQSHKILVLSDKNESLQESISSLKQTENRHLGKISSLEKANSLIEDKERSNTERLRADNMRLEQKLLSTSKKMNHLEHMLEQFANEKIALIEQTNEQMNKMREYVCQYQKYYQQQQQIQRHNKEKQQSSSILTSFFG